MDLAQSIQALPPELFDLIYDYTFTIDIPIQTIDENYRPPARLQVDTISRAAFAKSYYATTFHIKPGNHDILGTKWLSSLPSSHIQLIHRIVVPKLFAYGKSCDCFVPDHAQAVLADYRIRDWITYLKSTDIYLPPGALRLSIFGKFWSFDEKRQLKMEPDASEEFKVECKAHLGTGGVVGSNASSCVIQ